MRSPGGAISCHFSIGRILFSPDLAVNEVEDGKSLYLPNDGLFDFYLFLYSRA